MSITNISIIESSYQMAVFYLILIFSTSCQSGQRNSIDATVIKGNIQFSPGDKIYFVSFADTIDLYLEKKSALDSSLIDEKGNYTLTLHIKNPCAFNLQCGKKNLAANLFLSPGDNLEMNFIGKNHKPFIKRSGPEAKYNNYLIQFVDSFYNDPVLKPQYYIASNYMDLKQFVSYTDTRKQHQLGFFQSFFKGDSLRPEFRDYAVNTIEYGIAVDRLLYLWKKRMKSEAVNPDSGYYYFATPSYLENKHAFSCPAYIHFLNLYIMDTYVRMLEKGALPEKKSAALIPQVEKYKLAVQLLKPPFRDVVLLGIITNEINSMAQEDTTKPGSSASMIDKIEWFKNKYSLQ